MSSLVYSHDGQWLASADEDKTILLQNTDATGAIREFKGHTAGVAGVGFSKDDGALVSAGLDGTLRIWPIDGDGKSQEVQSELGPIPAFGVSDDGRFVASGNDTGLIRVWKWGQWDAPTEVRDLVGKIKIRALAFSPDGERFACGGDAQPNQPTEAFVFNTKELKLETTWPLNGSPMYSCRFSRDGRMLWTCGVAPVRGWDLAGKALKFDVFEFRGRAFAIAPSPDGKVIAACNGEAGLRFWDVQTSTVVGGVSGHWGGCLRSIAYSPDGKWLATGGNSGLVQIWDTQKWQQKNIDHGNLHHIVSLSILDNGSRVLTAGDESSVYECSLAKPASPRFLAHYQRASSLIAAAPDGRSYAVDSGTYGWEGHTLFIYDAADHKELHRVEAPHGFSGLVYSPDSKTILACGDGALAVLYDASTGRELHRFKGSTVLRAPCFSPDGKLLAIHDIHKTMITIWNVESGDEVTTWEQTPGVNSIAFDPNGERLALGNEAGNVVLRQVASGNVLRTLLGHGRRVQQVAFTPDGKTIISSSDDGTIRLWNPESSRAREVIPVGPPGFPLRFKTDPSGRYLFAYGASPLVFILRIDE